MIDPLRPDSREQWYLAGPIRGAEGDSVLTNIAIAAALCKLLWKAGLTVVCPHTNNGEIEGFGLADYLDKDFTFIANSKGIILLPRWQVSTGTLAEVDFAAQRGKEIVTVEYVLGREAVARVLKENE